MRRFALPAILGTILLVLLAATPPPLPVLGQPLPASGETLTGRHQLEQAGVMVRQYVTPRGVTLRAYAATNGMVFGLAWHGITPPDLQALLGSHYAAYRAAAQQVHRRGPVTIEAGALVVQLGGHMRDLRGRAYLASAIPAQLSPAVVR